MNKLIRHFEGNALLYLDLLVSIILLGVNLFVGYQLYVNVVEDVSPKSLEGSEVVVTKLAALEKSQMALFEEDQLDRKSFEIGVKEDYTNTWEQLTRQVDPFLR